jgi:hypothetical protein
MKYYITKKNIETIILSLIITILTSISLNINIFSKNLDESFISVIFNALILLFIFIISFIFILFIKEKIKIIFSKTNNAILKNTKLFYSTIIFDTIFFLLYGFVNQMYIQKIQEHLEVLQIILMTAKGVDLKSNPNLGTLIMNSQTSPYIINILLLSILSILSTYLLFCFFLGISNSIRTNLLKFNKSKLKEYMYNFYKNSAKWFLIYIIFNITTLYVTFTNTIRPKLNMSFNSFAYILPFMGIILTYLFITSFSYNTKKNSFKKTIKESFKNIITNGFIFLLALIILNSFMLFVLELNILSNFILSFLVLIIFVSIISYILIFYNFLQNKNNKNENN